MEPYYVTDEQRKTWSHYLRTTDYERVAEKSGYSFSTVNNILNQRTKVNERTQEVVDAFNEICREALRQELELIKQGKTVIQQKPQTK